MQEHTLSLAKFASIDRDSFDVLSVDVFDTLLLRDASLQRTRFRAVSALLATTLGARGHDVDAATLLALRLRAHDLAYRAVSMERPDGEAKLAQIVLAQIGLLGLDPSLTGLFIEAEFAVEARHLTPNRRLITALQQLRREGTRVIAISDMYLSAVEIQNLIAKVTGFVPVEKIYASSDFGLTKQSGRLFAAVAAVEEVPVTRILHCGDHETADLAMARGAGCQAILFKRPDWMRAARRLAALRFVGMAALQPR